MNRNKFHRILLAALVGLLCTATACRQDEAEQLQPGTARLQTKAVDGTGKEVNFTNGMHLYRIKSDNSIASYTEGFKPGTAIDITAITGVTLAATTGTGTLSFPESGSTTNNFITIKNGSTIPTLFLGTTTVATSATLIPITLQCATAYLSLTVTDKMNATALKMKLTNMSKGIGLNGTNSSETESYPFTLIKTGNTFTADLNCFPTNNTEATFTCTVTDAGGEATSTFTLPAIEKGKSYYIALTLIDNRIRVGNVSVEDWEIGSTLNGGEAQEPID